MIVDKKDKSSDKLPWLLLPCMMLTLGSMTLLVPRRPALAASPPMASAASKPALEAYDDGDGDELLEHWGDPKYAREERVQMAGLAGGFLLLAGFAWRKRASKQATLQIVSITQEASTELRKAA